MEKRLAGATGLAIAPLALGRQRLRLPNAFENEWIAAAFKDRTAVLNFFPAGRANEAAYGVALQPGHGRSRSELGVHEAGLASHDLYEWTRQGY